MTKCGQQNCDNDATEKMYWPEHDPLPTCPEHKQAALNIAAAMGFHLVFEPMPTDETIIQENG